MEHEFTFTQFRFLKIGSFYDNLKLGFRAIPFHHPSSGSSPRLLANRRFLRRNQADPRPGFAAIARLSAGFRGCAVARGGAQSRTAGRGREVARGWEDSPWFRPRFNWKRKRELWGRRAFRFQVWENFLFYREESSSQFWGNWVVHYAQKSLITQIIAMLTPH